MYFANFPYTFYSLDDRQSVQFIRNITLRAVINDKIKQNYALYDEYDIKDGETPEILADKFYNNSNYHWIILHMNEIHDPRFEWPLSVNNLLEYTKAKYGAANINNVHHYEDNEGYVVNSNAPFATPVTNFLYEDRLNESKRRIKILKPQYVSTVNREFRDSIESAI